MTVSTGLFFVCVHPRLVPDAATYALIDPDNPGRFIYAVHVRVFCPDCQCKFRFLGDNPLAPKSPREAQQNRGGAWVTGAADELGCMISPIEPGETLEGIEVQGRA